MSPAGWAALIAGVGLLLNAFVIYAGRLARYRCVLMPVHIIFTDTDLSFTFVLMNSGNRYVALTSLALAIEPFGTTSHEGASARLKSRDRPAHGSTFSLSGRCRSLLWNVLSGYSSPPAGDADADGIKKVLWRRDVLHWYSAVASSYSDWSALYPIPLIQLVADHYSFRSGRSQVYLQPVVLRPTLEYTYSPAAMYSSPPAGDADADGIKKVLWRMAVIVTDSEGCSTGTPLGGIEIWRQALSSSPSLRKSDSGSALYPIPLMDRRNWWPID